MGIESDRLVFDYLSKVGDLAQTALPAAGRMRLVAQLRDDIDRARDKTASDSPATVRRILGRMGSPDEVVLAAAESGAAAGPASPPPTAAPPPPVRPPEPPGAGPEVPGSPDAGSRERPSAADRDMFVKRGRGAAPETAAPEWWRGAPAAGPGVPGGAVPGSGWTGGLILSEFDGPGDPGPAQPGEPAAEPEPEPVAAARPGGFRLPLRSPFRRRSAEPAVVEEPVETGRRGLPTGPLEVLAAAGLVAGAVMMNYVLLAAGWLLAYACRGIGRRQSQFAAMGLPGIVLLGALVWLWGRTTGHWGARLSDARLGAALSADFPVVLRVAAAASALYLVWRGVVRRG